MKVAVASTKGGSGKTITAMFLAAALAKDGKTLVFDADRQGSALSWSSKTDDLPFEVMVAAVVDRDMERQAENYEHIIVDCSPHDMNAMTRAIRASDHVILPAQPTAADLDKILELEDLVLDEREDNGLPTLHVLLTRVIKRTRGQSEARQIIRNNAIDLFAAEIYQKQAIAMANGLPINDLYEYADIAKELLDIHRKTVGEHN